MREKQQRKKYEFTHGGIAELFEVCYPLMISMFSMMAMMFVDRLFVANYSPQALGAVAAASSLGWAFIMAWQALVAIGAVFISQYNGAKKFKKLGAVTWQMIWLSLSSTVFFLLLGYYLGDLLWGNDLDYVEKIAFFPYMMYFAPAAVLYTSIATFYQGRGKTIVLTWLAIVANGMNVGLDYVLIYGFAPFVQPMGVKGAAISTGISNTIQVVILFILFVRKKNRQQFGTGDYHWQSSLVRQTLNWGLPQACNVAIESLAWSVFYWMMAKVSNLHIFVAGVCQSLVIFLFFFGESLRIGVEVVAGNLIGAGVERPLLMVLRSALVLIAGFFLVLVVLYLGLHERILPLFLKKDVIELVYEDVRLLMPYGLLISGIYLLFEKIRMVLYGLLTAIGDTKFLMLANGLATWIFMALPAYYFVYLPRANILIGLGVWAGFSVITAALLAWRFYRRQHRIKVLSW
jgi:MATE family multidrug resistance protein